MPESVVPSQELGLRRVGGERLVFVVDDMSRFLARFFGEVIGKVLLPRFVVICCCFSFGRLMLVVCLLTRRWLVRRVEPELSRFCFVFVIGNKVRITCVRVIAYVFVSLNLVVCVDCCRKDSIVDCTCG
jgi:hypothetical protein